MTVATAAKFGCHGRGLEAERGDEGSEVRRHDDPAILGLAWPQEPEHTRVVRLEAVVDAVTGLPKVAHCRGLDGVLDDALELLPRSVFPIDRRGNRPNSRRSALDTPGDGARLARRPRNLA